LIVPLEVTDKLPVLPVLLECWEADLLIELHRFCHFADMPGFGMIVGQPADDGSKVGRSGRGVGSSHGKLIDLSS